MLIQPVSMEEVKKALFSIHGDKAPGPDGYNSTFYQKNWEIVGLDLVHAIQHFFSRGFLLKSWNATAISLVPRVTSPTTMKEFRPIACCNVNYKCISKILANRLQGVLPYLIIKLSLLLLKVVLLSIMFCLCKKWLEVIIEILVPLDVLLKWIS